MENPVARFVSLCVPTGAACANPFLVVNAVIRIREQPVSVVWPENAPAIRI